MVRPSASEIRFLTLAALLALAMLLMACTPVDQSIQEEIGNMPDSQIKLPHPPRTVPSQAGTDKNEESNGFTNDTQAEKSQVRPSAPTTSTRQSANAAGNTDQPTPAVEVSTRSKEDAAPDPTPTLHPSRLTLDATLKLYVEQVEKELQENRDRGGSDHQIHDPEILVHIYPARTGDEEDLNTIKSFLKKKEIYYKGWPGEPLSTSDLYPTIETYLDVAAIQELERLEAVGHMTSHEVMPPSTLIKPLIVREQPVQKEEPTAVPTPTLECVYFSEDQGTPTCFVSPTPYPMIYAKLNGSARRAAWEAQEEGATRDKTHQTVSVQVHENELIEGSHDTIKNWLDERNISYYESEYTFAAYVPAIQLGPLSELEAVGLILSTEKPYPADGPAN